MRVDVAMKCRVVFLVLIGSWITLKRTFFFAIFFVSTKASLQISFPSPFALSIALKTHSSHLSYRHSSQYTCKFRFSSSCSTPKLGEFQDGVDTMWFIVQISIFQTASGRGCLACLFSKLYSARQWAIKHHSTTLFCACPAFSKTVWFFFNSVRFSSNIFHFHFFINSVVPERQLSWTYYLEGQPVCWQ